MPELRRHAGTGRTPRSRGPDPVDRRPAVGRLVAVGDRCYRCLAGRSRPLDRDRGARLGARRGVGPPDAVLLVQADPRRPRPVGDAGQTARSVSGTSSSPGTAAGSAWGIPAPVCATRSGVRRARRRHAGRRRHAEGIEELRCGEFSIVIRGHRGGRGGRDGARADRSRRRVAARDPGPLVARAVERRATPARTTVRRLRPPAGPRTSAATRARTRPGEGRGRRGPDGGRAAGSG
jgi:hypothetical protein